MIAHIDEGLTDLIQDKKTVLYTPNNKGQMPSSYNKGLIPSSIPIDMNWYIGYTNFIMEGFNMFEISDEIAEGLQFFNTIDGANKRYDKFFVPNENNEKLTITLDDDELFKQLTSKKYLMVAEVNRIYDIKFKQLIQKYGAESNTWRMQLSEAEAYIKDNNSNCPIIKAISESRNIDIVDVANDIILNNNKYITAIGSLLGSKYSIKDSINGCSTNADLINILDTLNTI